MDSIRLYPNINGIREQQKLRFLPFTKLLEKSVRSYYDGNVGAFPDKEEYTSEEMIVIE